MGRPKILDDEKRQIVVALATAGMQMKEIARYVGCNLLTISRERKSNAEFDASVRRARMAAKLKPLEAMRRASATHWRAAAWMLERDDRQHQPRTAAVASLFPRRTDVLVKALVHMIHQELDDQNLLLAYQLEERVKQSIQLWAASPIGPSPRNSSVTVDKGPSPADLRQSMQMLDARLASRMLGRPPGGKTDPSDAA